MALNENAKKWVEALRSGKYSQCEGTLQNVEGYCCLGVACDVYEKEAEVKLPRNKHGFYELDTLSGGFKVVRDWLGLVDSEGGMPPFKGQKDQRYIYTTLTKLNDHARMSFNEIADVIESREKGIFKN